MEIWAEQTRVSCVKTSINAVEDLQGVFALAGSDHFCVVAPLRFCHLFANILQVSHAVVWRWSHDTLSASVVWRVLRFLFPFSISELVNANAMEQRRYSMAQATPTVHNK